MAQNSHPPAKEDPQKSTPEVRFLDLWEENIRITAANGPAQQAAKSDD